MTKRNRAAVYICARTVQPQLFFNSKVLGSKSFINFDEVNVRHFKPSLLQSLTRSGYWSDAHYVRFNTGIGPTNDSADRFRAALFQVFFSTYDQRRRTIDNSRGIPCGYKTILRESRLQLCQIFRRCLWSQVIVCVEDNR